MTMPQLFQKFATGLTATSVVLGVSLLTVQKAEALSLIDFVTGGSVTSNGWTATGIGASPFSEPYRSWDVNLDALGDSVLLTVSRGNQNTVDAPASILLRYSLTGPALLESAVASLDFSSADRAGSITKQIFSDAGFTNLIGTASVTVIPPDDTTTVNANFQGLNTLYIQDSINTTAGSLSSYTNGYQKEVPEPITMLGAGAAIAFGASFKHRKNKNLQNDQNG